MQVAGSGPGLEAEPGGERPEHRPLEEEAGEDEDEGERDGVEEVTEPGELPRLYPHGLVVGQLGTVEALPVVAGRKPNVLVPKPCGDGPR